MRTRYDARGALLRCALGLSTVAAFASVPGSVAEAANPPTNQPAAACLADGQVEDILQVDGVAYLAGRFTHVRPPGAASGGPEEVARQWFAACDAATGAVLDWNPQVTCDAGTFPSCSSNPRGQTLALAADRQSIYIGGKFRGVGGQTRRHAARVSRASAALDPTWLPEPNDRVQRIVLAPDGGRVYVAGNFTQAGGCAPAPCHAHLAAVDPTTGAAAAAFDPAISSAGDGFATVYALAFSTDGATIYVGGQFDTIDGEARSSVAAIDAATGSVATAFAPDLADTNPSDLDVQVYDVIVDRDWIYVCGDWWITDGIGSQQNQRNVNRFAAADGAVDLDFWIATDGGVQACALDLDLGVLFVGGHFDCVRAWVNSATPVDPNPAQCGTDSFFVGTFQRDLLALSLDDGTLLPWNPDTGGIAGTWAMARGEGRLMVGGELTWPRTGSATHQSVLAFDVWLFADDFERGDTARWTAATPP